MRSLGNCFVLGSVLVVGCAAPADEGVDHAGADLSASPFEEACSPPVRSEDGKFVALDLCPTSASPGRLVRVDIGSGSSVVIAEYAATERVEELGAAGGNLIYAVRRTGPESSGVDVAVHAWASAAGRTVRAQAPAGVAGDFGALRMTMLSADGSQLAFAAVDGPLASFVFVAPVTGGAAPVAVDLGVPSRAVRWSTSGSTFLGHVDDETAGTGETLLVVETGGAAGATLAAKRHVGLTSFAFGQGGTRAQEPFDGTRVLGFRKSETDGAVVGTVDPRTGIETILDAAPVLGIVTDLGPDVLYARVTEVTGGGGFVRELVKQARAGGSKTVLVAGSGASFEELRYGFDPLAVSRTAPFGVFATRNAAGADERWLVRLDGSSPATKLGDGLKVREQVGDRVLIEDVTVAAAFGVLDLTTGETTPVGPSSGGLATLAGDGSVVQLVHCTSPEVASGTRIVHLRASGPTTSDCGWRPWASVPVASANSDAVVYYSSWGPFPDYRYDVAIVKP